jgi:hypothetical protein
MSTTNADQGSGQKPGLLQRLQRFKRLAVIAAGVMAAGGVAIQFIPVKGVGVNPEERYALKAPPEVQEILRNSCMDCHSNETKWPWYARLAPSSWLMVRDVKKGRAHMNMSEWSDDDVDAMNLDKENSWDEIEEGHMPPWFYIYPMPTHWNGYLTDKKKEILKGWLLAHKTAPAAKQASTGSPPPAN